MVEVDDLESYRETSTNTGSEANFALVNEWMDRCKTNHAICGQLNKNTCSWYPTRLLEIGPLGTLRLRITGINPPTGPYLSLSHCWGSAVFLKLTLQNIDSLKFGISCSTLPKTFRDAAYITHKLGLKYLWIDSLCIVQNSVEDWRREAATMGKVYQHAFCNIAATGASDSSVGCFWDRNPLLAQVCKIDLTWELPLKGNFYCLDGSLWPRNVGEAPLNRRGWVVQERILSPRILHFSMQQLFWECHEMEACESFPGGLPEAPDPMTFIVRTGLKRIKPSVKDKTHNEMRKTSKESRLDGYAYWDGIVDVYSRSSLTRQEDKLIALSGIAQEMSLLLNDDYLAGLWKNHLPSQLLWIVTSPLIANHGTPSFRPARYQAPTWSWASIVGHVVPGNLPPGHNWNTLPKVLNAYVEPISDDDPTGQIAAAQLHVHGLLRPATWQCLWHGHIYQLLFEDGQITPEYSTFWPDEITSSAPLPEQVYCFPLLSTYWDGTRTIDGLVLAQKGNSHEYTRIGKFRFQDEEDCWLLMKRPCSRSIDENVVYEELEEQTFTIT